VLVVLAGEVRVHGTTLTRGSTAVVPHAAGPLELTGDGEVLLARPPQT
jgi:mannose-6-phosphate isomerase